MSIELYPSIAKIKRNGVYENLPGFVPITPDVSVEEMIATSESTIVAQYTHEKFSYFILNDTLYKASEKINSGDSIVVGTNCEVAVIGNDLSDIAKIADTFTDDTQYTEYFPSNGSWSQGPINSSTGVPTTGTASIRSPYYELKDYNREITCKSGYKVLFYGFTENLTYLGWWKNGTFVKTSGALNYYVTNLDLAPAKETSCKYFRMVARRLDGATISTTECVNIGLVNSIPLINQERLDAIEPIATETLEAVEYDELIVDFTDNYYIKTNLSEGTTVDVNNPISSNAMHYKIVSCLKGDKFHLRGSGLDAPRLWAFTDTSYALLSKSQSNINVTEPIKLIAPADGYLIVNVHTSSYYFAKINIYENLGNDVYEIKNALDKQSNDQALSNLFKAQRDIAEDWRFGFINVSTGMGLGSNHIIPATATTWSESGTTDLNQKGVWMSDGVHPFKGDGVTDMYARTISEQLALIPPSYHDGVGDTTPTLWNGRTILWMGTSIPAGSDPDAGEGQGSTYPALVGTQLGASVVNKAKGSSCVRINASTGEYTGMIFSHFIRALTRTQDEADIIASNWDSIKNKIGNSPATLSEANVSTMKAHSFETLLLPYLDGTNAMPDLFVIDHGHNDVRPKGIDGLSDLWITPTTEMITNGVLAEDTYMTANNYANLKLAFNDDLTGISDLAGFAASVNRNCFKGAVNFIITLILRYNPYARIVVVSDYN